MWQFARAVRACIALTCVGLLVDACGGGGGGSAPAPVSLVVTSSSVSVSATTADSTPSAQINTYISADPNSTTQYFFSRTFTGNGIASVTSTGDGTASNYTVQFKLPSSLAPGTYKDTVTIKACYDGACQQQVQDSPQTVSVTYVVAEAAGMAPQLTALGPSAVEAGGDSFLLVVSGSNFSALSAVQWNGSPRNTTFISSTLLIASIGPSDIAGAAVIPVTVVNFGSAGTLVSNALSFTVSTLRPAASMAVTTHAISASFDTSQGGGPIINSPFAITVNGPTNATYYYSVSFTGSAVTLINVSGSDSLKSGTTVPAGPAAGRITGEPNGGQGGTVTGSFTGPTNIVSEVALIPAVTMGAGTYTDTITVSVCTDAQCAKPIAGSPKKIAVTYFVTGNAIPNAQLALLGGGSLILEAPTSASTAAVGTVTITSNGLPPYGAYVFTTIGTTAAIATAVVQSNLDGTGTLTVTTRLPASLGSGIYYDSVQVNICFDSGCAEPADHFPMTIPVTYVVDASPGIDFNQATILLEINDMAWNSVTQRIYATANSDTGGIKGSLVVINPMTASIEQVVSLGQEAAPTALALSDDGQFAYVIDQVANWVVRVNLSSMTIDETVPVAMIGPPYTLKVPPGQPNSFAVESNSNSTTLQIFDATVERAQAFSAQPLDGEIFYTWGADANTVYAYDGTMYQLSASSTGLAVAQQTPNIVLNQGYLYDLQYAGGLIYSSTASVYNPSTNTLQTPFSIQNSNSGIVTSFSFAVDASLNRAYFMTTDSPNGTPGPMSLEGFSLTTQSPTWITRFPSANPLGGRMLRWGTNGLAFVGAAVAGTPSITLISGSVISR